jgi:glycosyltransferase involved in cell wall biosynthesis
MFNLRVLWITNIASPYRIDFFNLLGVSVDLKVIFEREKSKERNDDWYGKNFDNFKYNFLKGLKFGADSSISISVIKHLKKNYDFIFISNPFTPTGILASFYLRLRRINFIIETDGGLTEKNECNLKRIIKSYILKGAYYYFASGKSNKEYFNYYGINSEIIHLYPFSSIKKSDIRVNPMSETDKKLLRFKYSMNFEKIILYVGRFVQIKGIDNLFEALRNTNKKYKLVLIGDSFKAFEKLKINTENVNFDIIEFINQKLLKDYYDLADFLVLPTRKDTWGLVINEAFSRGLPVIATDNCGAALELINDYNTGFIVESENPYELTQKIEYLLTKNLNQMKHECLKTINKYTIESMVKSHLDFFY